MLDKWFHRYRRDHLEGQAIIVRYVDDVVLGIERLDEAHAVTQALRERLDAWGLRLHPEKTRLSNSVEMQAGGGEREERGGRKASPFWA